jgi:transposase InsO family protein
VKLLRGQWVGRVGTTPGHPTPIASGGPVKPSQTTISTSATPRLRGSAGTRGLELRALAVAITTHRVNGWQGVRRGKKVRITIPDPAAERAPDLLGRQFSVTAPNRLFVADFAYVKLATGTRVYVSFIIDA